MSIIDTRPQNLDILCYAGDTLTLNITSTVDYSQYVWSGHIKSSPTADVIDAEFSFTPVDTETGSGTIATLSAEDTGSLGLTVSQALQSVRTSKVGISTQAVKAVPAQYSGVWDIQVEFNGIVTTLVKGTIKVDTDVTRL